MKLIIGLGNPTRKYRLTRHNAGFLAIDRIAEDLSVRLKRNNLLSSLIGEASFEGERIILQKPLTFMNLSGGPVEAVVGKKKVYPEDVMVICDDVNLDLGKVRIRRSGSSGGHNGLKSIVESLGTDRFQRFRIGIGGGATTNRDLTAYVLEEFTDEELNRLDKVLGTASEAIKVYLSEGIETAMNKYNNSSVE